MKITNIITIILITIAYTSFGQLTITAEDNFVSVTDKSRWKLVKKIGIALPDTGQNQIWDYSNLISCKDKSCESSGAFSKNTNPNFPTDAFVSNHTTTILGIPIPARSYYAIKNEEDFCYLGFEVFPAKFSLKTITGNPLDTLVVKHGIYYFDNKVTQDYPMAYGKKWVSSTTYTLNYSLNATTFPVTDFPLINTISNHVTNEVIGEGKLMLPYETSDGAIKTVTYNALLVRQKSNTVGNIHSIGERNEAIFTQMCNAIGLQKNYTILTESYFFYVRERYGSILSFHLMKDGSGKISKISIRSDLEECPPRED